MIQSKRDAASLPVRIFVPGKPIGKERPRVVLRKGRVHTYTPEKTAKWEEWVRWKAYDQLRKANREWKPWTGNVSLTLRFRCKPGRTDLDNRIKSCLDAIQGVLFVSDRQVRYIAAWYESPDLYVGERTLGEEGVLIEALEAPDATENPRSRQPKRRQVRQAR
jgi:Holliday junction resolvase RusA-like endonuclease